MLYPDCDRLGIGIKTEYGYYHTLETWNLYLTGPASISLPVPRTNYVEVPGRDGYLDLSTALTGEVTYNPREFSAPIMSLESPEAWPNLYSNILNTIHGKEAKIYLDEDPYYYYTGRLAVESPSYDGSAWNFSITGVLYPYKLNDCKCVGDLTDTDTEISFLDIHMPVVPEITVDAETILTWHGNTYAISAGTHKILDIRLKEGMNTLKARTSNGTGTITITYQKGSL